MKKFEILRYLKRFSLLIFLVSLAGAAAIYLYADGRQKYTASVIIRYTNDGISDGYTPDGSELDVNENYTTTVITQSAHCELSLMIACHKQKPVLIICRKITASHTVDRRMIDTGQFPILLDHISFHAKICNRIQKFFIM